MKQMRKIFISSDGSFYFYQELQIPKDDNEIAQFFFEDEKNFFLNNKKCTRPLNLKSLTKQKKKYFKKILEYSQEERHSFLIRALKRSNPFIPIIN